MQVPAAIGRISPSSEGLDDLFVESQLESQSSHVDCTESHVFLTVPEASTLLGVPKSTLYRHIKAGKYQSETGPDGVVRISVPSQSSLNNPIVRPVEERDANETRTENDALAELKHLRERLEAASYRIGYLESKLEEREKEVLLLRDTQAARASWITRLLAKLSGR